MKKWYVTIFYKDGDVLCFDSANFSSACRLAKMLWPTQFPCVRKGLPRISKKPYQEIDKCGT